MRITFDMTSTELLEGLPDSSARRSGATSNIRQSQALGGTSRLDGCCSCYDPEGVVAVLKD
jgi:hypothetical protein